MRDVVDGGALRAREPKRRGRAAVSLALAAALGMSVLGAATAVAAPAVAVPAVAAEPQTEAAPAPAQPEALLARAEAAPAQLRGYLYDPSQPDGQPRGSNGGIASYSPGPAELRAAGWEDELIPPELRDDEDDANAGDDAGDADDSSTTENADGTGADDSEPADWEQDLVGISEFDPSTLIGDTYPARYRGKAWPYVDNNIWDEWNFAYRQCTSFVAWRLNEVNGIPFTNQYGGLERWGDAGQWGTSARSLGITVDETPAVGAIAWSGAGYGDASSFGHVAWVAAVLDDGDVIIEEYNNGWSGSYNWRRIAPAAFQGYIHVEDVTEAQLRAAAYTPFTDVPRAHQFFTEIDWMYRTGLSTGIRRPDGYQEYRPKTGVSREAMAAFLHRLEKPEAAAPVTSPFADVAPGAKFYDAISWMRSSGLSTGIRSGGTIEYRPYTRLSREAMAAFLYRLEKPAGYRAPAVSPFVDVQPGDKFYTQISWMYESGLSTGMKQQSGKPKYAPKATVSREAMAAFLYRLEGRG